MRHFRMSIVFVYQFMAESVVFYLVLSLFPVTASLLSFISYFLYMISVLVLFVMIRPESGRPLRSLLFTGGLIGTGYLSGLSLFLLLLCGAFFLWRLFLHNKEEDLENERLILISAAMLTFIQLLLYNRPFAAGILVLTFVMVWVGQFTAGLLWTEVADKKESGRDLLLYSGLMTGAFAVILGGYPLFSRILTLLFKGVLYLLTGVFTGFLYLLAFFGFDLEDAGTFQTDPLEQLKWGETEIHQMTNTEGGENGSRSDQVAQAVEWWGYGLAVAFLLLVILLLYKNWNNKREETLKKDAWTYSSSGIQVENRYKQTRRRFRRSSSSGYVRQQFRRFEKEAERLGFPRHTYESAGAWFQRLDLSYPVLEVYEKARYGGIDLTEQETRQFADQLDGLKKQLACRKEV
ncbi:DUF4129 domain-containing protein [Halobacillus sp. Cin3]|uniref:DUF4129 domain-containing protein n=1 Tax=Halobacillus sp. Cin3 TaxID=2928441 RepID=UPI00248E8DB2|nr:DUF4129 domain-containing protein [Halobacillus sp. Cin3]